jgi:hypothetical protein
LAVVHDGEVMMGVNNDPILAAGDRLIVLCPSTKAHAERARKTQPAPDRAP